MEKVTERYNYSNYYNRCYKMKLYLEQFNIPCCVLNSELPVATRLHTVSFLSFESLISIMQFTCTPFDWRPPSRWNSSTEVFTM